MEGLTIVCESCEHNWTANHAYSVYEQQALESRPCPHCGCCTLSLAHVPEVPWRRHRLPTSNYGKAS